jgi:transposase-like protein
VRDRRALAASERTIKRRRRFSLEEKRAILMAAGETEPTVSEVSGQYGVGRSVIHNWRRQEALAANFPVGRSLRPLLECGCTGWG